jgi:hypothetical protein
MGAHITITDLFPNNFIKMVQFPDIFASRVRISEAWMPDNLLLVLQEIIFLVGKLYMNLFSNAIYHHLKHRTFTYVCLCELLPLLGPLLQVTEHWVGSYDLAMCHTKNATGCIYHCPSVIKELW